MTKIIAKRVYEKPGQNDGHRVLVDRLWPRGIKKEELIMDEWLKSIAPSTELRKWFSHDASRFNEFAALYRSELDNNDGLSEKIKEWREYEVVTLLYGAKDPLINHAVVLVDYISECAKNQGQ